MGSTTQIPEPTRLDGNAERRISVVPTEENAQRSIDILATGIGEVTGFQTHAETPERTLAVAFEVR